MVKLRFYILFFFTCFVSLVQAQKAATYSIENNEVVFNFDVRDYKKVTKDNTSGRLDFDDLKIYEVTVAGEFNNWSRDKWRMKKTGDYTYQLRKKLKDFEDEFSWEFKFVINGKYWAEPTDDFDNITESEKSHWWYKVYNLKMYTANPASNGNAQFYLKGYGNARKVILSGTFNRWNENAFKMQKVKGGWQLTLKLKPDTYQYKFIVDGKWMEDPDNPDKIYNEHHTFNSILTIKKPVTFELDGYENASKIVLTGDFNSWNKENCIMKKDNNGKWHYTLTMKGGKHHYKFIVDGKWITDPSNSIKEYDAFGNINSVKMVD